MADDIQNLINNYQPNLDILKTIVRIKLLATVGPAASGKTVVAKKMVDESDEFHFVLGETSRHPRPGERDGVDYAFRSREEIIDDLKSGALVDVVVGPNGDLYSTRLGSYSMDKINVMALIPPAVLKYRELPLKLFTAAFIVPETYEKWRAWLAERAQHSHWTDEQMRGRLAEAKKSYEFALSDSQMNFVLNDQVDSAARRLRQAVGGQTPDDQDLAKQTAAANLAELDKDLAGK